MSRKQFPRVVADAVQARAGGLCEAWIPGVCTTRAEHLHHRQMRSQGGQHTVPNIAVVCHCCHGYVHQHPREAYEHGWLVSAYASPSVVSMLRRGLRTILRDDGRVLIDEEV